MDKKSRFFYHYNKFTGKMTVHFGGQCIPVDNIVCNVPCETKWNKIQPHLVMRGWCDDVIVDENKKATII